MGATHSEMGAPQGLLSIFLVSGLLLGTCLSEQACVDDACFDQSIQQLKIERSKTDQASGLNYKERTTDLVATLDVIGVCLPGVNPNVLADSFLSCSNEKVEEVCTMVKRGCLEESASGGRQKRAAGEKKELADQKKKGKKGRQTVKDKKAARKAKRQRGGKRNGRNRNGTGNKGTKNGKGKKDGNTNAEKKAEKKAARRAQ